MLAQNAPAEHLGSGSSVTVADRYSLPPLESPVRAVRRGVSTEGVRLPARAPELPSGCRLAGTAGGAAPGPGPTDPARDE